MTAPFSFGAGTFDGPGLLSRGSGIHPLSVHFVSVEYVADLLDISIEDAQILGDEIGVPSDVEWDADAIDEARALLEDEDEELDDEGELDEDEELDEEE